MGPDEDRLPVYELAVPLPHVEHPQVLRLVGRLPLLRLGDAVAARAQLLVERHGRTVGQHLLQLGLAVGDLLVGTDFEQVQREHFGVLAEEGAAVVGDHL